MGLVAAELTVRGTHADQAAVNRALAYSMADVAVREPDPGFLQYRSRPGAHGVFDGRYGPYTVTIGPDGDRGGQLPITRRPGSLRIAVIGASTVFGADVSDEQTLPARLQDALRARGVDADVGNFGVSAWVTSQIAHQGRMLLDRDLDLLIFIHTNQGPRPFLWPGDLDTADFSAWFDADPQRWLENIPGAGLPDPLHVFLLQHSAAWRLVTARLRGEANAARRHAYALGRQEVLALQSDAAQAGVPVVTLLWPEGWDGWPQDLPPLSADRAVDLDSLVEDPALKVEHPPPEGLAWYGKLLADLVLDRGWLPITTPPASPVAPER
ncbi:MAG: hypothetical protein GXP62_06995 [Oligoflexia bacterium]|nr:hypothetical protein [Oligoflexia bacterium]